MAYVMAFIKKNTALLIPVGILLLVILVLIPTILTGKSVRKDMDNSIRDNSNVRSWISKASSSKQSRIEKAFQDEHARDADAIDLQVKQSTMRELISYQVFPEPGDTSVQLFTDFGKKFRSRVDSLITRMNARNAPTDQELNEELVRRGGADANARRRRRSPSNPEDVSFAIEDAFLVKRASQIPVYASANLFGLYDYWEDFDYQGPQAIEDCWYSQLALWVHGDITDTITSMNSDSRSASVLTSPVKRLVGVSFQKRANYSRRRGSSRTRGQSSADVKGDFPVYLIRGEDKQSQPGNLRSVLGAESWTTRICDEDIDVMHFSVSVIVESNAVFSFMKELCREKHHNFYGFDGNGSEETFKHNQISILEFTQGPVARKDKDNSKYRYGDAAVVKLDLVCEYIFHKDGYDEIKPQAIKELLGDAEETPEGGDDFSF